MLGWFAEQAAGAAKAAGVAADMEGKLHIMEEKLHMSLGYVHKLEGLITKQEQAAKSAAQQIWKARAAEKAAGQRQQDGSGDSCGEQRHLAGESKGR